MTIKGAAEADRPVPNEDVVSSGLWADRLSFPQLWTVEQPGTARKRCSMNWDSLRQGVTYGVLDDLVKLVAALVLTVALIRLALRTLRFPDRFIDDSGEGDPPVAPEGDRATGGPTREG